MNTEKKVIKISSDLLKTKKERNTKSSSKRLNSNNNNNIKKNLINRIQQHKSKENTSRRQESAENVADPFSDEFNESLKYLESLSKQKSNNPNIEKRAHIGGNKESSMISQKNAYNNTTLKTKTASVSPRVLLDVPKEFDNFTNENICIDFSNLNVSNSRINDGSINATKATLSNDVPYGVLKNGKKPTFREWNRTQKIRDFDNFKHFQIENPRPQPSLKNEREKKLLNIIQQHSRPENNCHFDTTDLVEKQIINGSSIKPDTISSSTHNEQKKHCNTIKTKYTVGKNEKSRKISLILKNISTRKEITRAQKELKKENLVKMKEYLRDHNLIKTGSYAPNDVIINLYENSKMSGNLINTCNENLIHNFMETDNF